jgi:multiple sugar transport system permease protein
VRRPDREQRGLLLMLTPYLLGLVGLIAAPALITFGLAFFEYDLIGSPRWLAFDNFSELWNDEIFGHAVRNSLLFVAFAVPLRLLGALGLALLLHRRFRGVGAYRTAAYLPTVVPDVAYALLWLWILNPLYGPLNLALEAAGGPTPSWLTDPRAAQAAIVLMSVFQLGEGFLVALAVRQSLPEELYEVSAIERAGPWYTFSRITLPLMAPALLLLAFRDAVYSLQVNFVPALIVTEGGPPPYATTYLPLFVYRNAFEYLRYGYAAAATLAMFLATALIVYVQFLIVRRWRRAYALR